MGSLTPKAGSRELRAGRGLWIQVVLIESGGGMGPMKPGNSRRATCIVPIPAEQIWEMSEKARGPSPDWKGFFVR